MDFVSLSSKNGKVHYNLNKGMIKIITQLLLQSQGVDISTYEATFLKKSIQKRMSETQSGSLEDYTDVLQNSKDEVGRFMDSLQIGYTEFFRNSLTFSVLEKIIIPVLGVRNATNRNEIRIWSAACSTGQEVYSLAMLLNEFPNINSDELKYRIFATDQSHIEIQEAQKGVYTQAALGNLSLKRVDRWFTKQGNEFLVRDELKENIEFSVFDLFNDQYSSPPTSIFGDFDIILCANLLFYYQQSIREKIIEKTSQSISKNGYLITGETEREILMHSGFQEIYPMSAIFKK